MLLRVMTLSYCIHFKFVQDHMIIYGALYKYYCKDMRLDSIEVTARDS